MDKTSLATINVVVYNGEKYLRQCLDAVKNQTYPNLEVNIFDNASTDRTREIAKEIIGNWKLEIGNSRFSLIESKENLGMWPGQEQALKYTHGEYVVALSVDVVMDADFVSRAVSAAEKDPAIGAIQAKIYQYDFGRPLERKLIDTLGFRVSRSRRVVNIAHGETENGQHEKIEEIFAVEGAVPFFRRSALEDIRIGGEIADHDYFWYGDDLDLAWRMRLFGWKQVMVPDVVAWHDRSTTKGVSTVPIIGQLARLRQRRQIPIAKRRLDWANVRFTIIKNDYIINVLRDLPRILGRELMVFGYTVLFEPSVFMELPRFIKLLPKMIRKRGMVMQRAKSGPVAIRQWFK